jgi:hypothetical protein
VPWCSPRCGKFEKTGRKIDEAEKLFTHRSRPPTVRVAHEQWNVQAGIISIALAMRQAIAMIGGLHHYCVVGQPISLKGIKKNADLTIHDCDIVVEASDVAADDWRVW